MIIDALENAVTEWEGDSDEFEKALAAARELQAELAKPEPDWDLLKATQDSLREHMARIKELEAELAKQTVLDKKAENARELGLDYELEQEPVAWATLNQAGQLPKRS